MNEGRETETDGRDGARGTAGRDGDEALPMLRTDLAEKDGADLGALLEKLDDLERNDDDELELERPELELRLVERLPELPTLRDTLLLRLPRICAVDSVAPDTIISAPTKPTTTDFVDMTATTFRVQRRLVTNQRFMSQPFLHQSVPPL